ncbi:uncharacterized protein LOC114449794, partial [Parambassis ranga]|uniref:Uncharacterized protein LOC114449794 n=1 Tax=Parambassis ranga TaxID=210632 RepID=A0A6P7K772_9TELE
MEHWLWILLAALFFECKGQDSVTQQEGDVTAAEGDTVTLGCSFKTSSTSRTLFWYKQEVNDSPKSIVMRVAGVKDPEDSKESRFDAELKDTSVPLKIQKLQLSDSAVYYCALQWRLNRDPSLLSTGCSSQLVHTADMRPLFMSVLLAALCLECRAQTDNVLQTTGELRAAEGGALTLGCLYNSSRPTGNNLYWYKQDGNNRPRFILSRVSLDEGNTADEFKERFSSTLNSTFRSAPLKIQKLQLSDSAVYYCAL